MSKKSNEYVESKRKEIVDHLLDMIEKNPLAWEKGWYGVDLTPINGQTEQRYHGINALQFYFTAIDKGYSDPRWVTFNQANDLGARVKAGEKGTTGLTYKIWDYKTKKEFDEETVKDMTLEEMLKYKEENVKAFTEVFHVYNAEQCENMPEFKKSADVKNAKKEMPEDERVRQNQVIETIISNSAAPVKYDGENRAFYAPDTDDIHLPEIKKFKSMQDYYATALHEIAHSTGHESRLNREIRNKFGSENYAREELRAELASVFMQFDCGIKIEGQHFENHAAYLQSWLSDMREKPQEFLDATKDAQKISQYVAEHYMEKTNDKAPAHTDDFSMFNTAYTAPDIDFFRQVNPEWLHEAYPEKSKKEIKDAFIKYGAELTTAYDGVEVIALTDKFLTNYKAERERRLSDGEKLNDETLNSNVKTWYKKTYPTDELGDEINDELAFKDIGEFKQAATKDLYDLIGVRDSVVRERCEIKFYEVAAQDKAIKAYTDAHPQKTEPVQVAVPSEKKPFAVRSENIPVELKNLPNWYAVRVDKAPDGRLRKIPISPHQSGYCSDAQYLKHGKPGDTSTCGTYAEAEALAKKWGLPGVGMDLTNSGYVFVDIDHCLVKGDGIQFNDNNAGKLAQRILPQCKNLYVEKSVSGTGLHVIYKGSRPQDRGNRNDEQGLEVYDNARFAAFTGDSAGGVTSIGEPSQQLQMLLSDALKPAVKQQTQSTVRSSVLSQSDAEVIDRIRNSQKAAEFNKLYAGECLHTHSDGTPDQSRSDFRLCSIVAFFAQGDAVQTERIFRSSAAFRADKGNDYVTRTVGKACANITQQIKPPTKQPPTKQKPQSEK